MNPMWWEFLASIDRVTNQAGRRDLMLNFTERWMKFRHRKTDRNFAHHLNALVDRVGLEQAEYKIKYGLDYKDSARQGGAGQTALPGAPPGVLQWAILPTDQYTLPRVESKWDMG